MDELTNAPQTPVAPAPEPTPEAPKINPADFVELANKLYDAATKLLRDAETLKKAAENDEAKEKPLEDTEKMSPDESEAATRAMLGL